MGMGVLTDDNIIGFMKAGKYRIKILELLKNFSIIPSEIAKKLSVEKSQISRTLSKLKELGLITCTTPNRIRGRIYRVTEKGTQVLASLEEK